ncbi:MAG: hypothetical protein ACYCR5_11145 [Leptospirillum sp.]
MAIKTLSQIGDKQTMATTTVHQCRGGLFLPFKKNSRHFQGIDKPFENQWGRVTLKKCRLTQTHQNILDSIIVNAHGTRKLPDGRIAFLYSPAKVLRYMGITPKHHSWLYDKLSDLLTTEVEIETITFRASGTILYEKAESKVPIPGRYLPSGKRDGQRIEPHYQLVVFHPFFSLLFNLDVALHYRECLPEILQLEHAVTQAVVRFCLSHDTVNMALNDVLSALDAIRPGLTDRAVRKITRQVRDESEALRRGFGIEIRQMEDGREGVFYKKHPKVRFESQKQPEPKQVSFKIQSGETASAMGGTDLIPTPEKAESV